MIGDRSPYPVWGLELGVASVLHGIRIAGPEAVDATVYSQVDDVTLGSSLRLLEGLGIM